MINHEFECPVAKKTVTFSTRMRVRDGFPPVEEFVGCSGLAGCGVAPPDGFGSYNWLICPKYSSMNG